MTIGSGIAATVGFAPESTYGTGVTPARWLPFNTEALDYVKTPQVSLGLSGNLAPFATRRVIPTAQGKGSVSLDFLSKGMGQLFKPFFGTSTSTLVSGSAYQQNHSIGDTKGQSLTIQKGVVDASGTIRPYTFIGCKGMSLDMSAPLGGLVSGKFEFDAKDVLTSTAYAVPSFTNAANLFHFLQGTITVGGSPTYATTTTLATGGTSVAGVRAFDVVIDRGLDVNGFYFNNAGRKTEPTVTTTKITGKLDIDFVDATFPTAELGDTQLALVLTFQSTNLISAGVFETVQIAIPAIKLDGELPKIANDQVVQMSCGFSAFLDGTNPLATLSYVTSDITL